jgi:serine/threonine protein kinase
MEHEQGNNPPQQGNIFYKEDNNPEQYNNSLSKKPVQIFDSVYKFEWQGSEYILKLKKTSRNELAILQKLKTYPLSLFPSLVHSFYHLRKLFIVTSFIPAIDGITFMEQNELVKIPMKTIVQILDGMVHCVHTLHMMFRIVHCDLKPDNFLIVPRDSISDNGNGSDGENSLSVSLIDFDLACDLDRTQKIIGTTYGWCAPEVHTILELGYTYSKSLCYKLDIYSLGLCMFAIIFRTNEFLECKGYLDTLRVHKKLTTFLGTDSSLQEAEEFIVFENPDDHSKMRTILDCILSMINISPSERPSISHLNEVFESLKPKTTRETWPLPEYEMGLQKDAIEAYLKSEFK